MVLPAAGDGLSLDAMALVMPHKRPMASRTTTTAARSRPLECVPTTATFAPSVPPHGQTVLIRPTKARTRSPGQQSGAILRAVIIDDSREPRLQLGDAEPFRIDSAEVTRDIERSTLTNIVLNGDPFRLPVGARVTLWTGPNVVFVGKAVDEHHVLDLLSTETDDQLAGDETI